MHPQATLKYPAKSHRKPISVPLESFGLAEFMGIVLGDGGINNDWQLVITLNSDSDLGYSQYVVRLIGKLFQITPAVRKRPRKKALVIVSSSMNLLDFLYSKGAVKGNKIIQQIDIPAWIQGVDKYEKAFVRGLVDTDGCLFIHKKKNSYIGLCFTSGSIRLIRSVAKIFEKFGIKSYITDKERRIYLYSMTAVKNYLNIFGSSNQRIWKKYNEWRGVRVV